MASKSTALALVENYGIAPAEIAELAQAIKEEIGAMGALDLPRTNVPAGGSSAWSVKATSDDKRPTVTDALEGVIIMHHPFYAYYSNPKPAPGTGRIASSAMAWRIPPMRQDGFLRDLPYNFGPA